MPRTILIVDDEPSLTLTMAAILERAGYHAVTASNATEALKVIEQIEPDLVISDVVMPGMNGVEMAVAMRSTHPRTPLILISGNATTEDILASARVRGHSFEVLAKPMPPRELLARIAEVLPCKGAHAAFA